MSKGQRTGGFGLGSPYMTVYQISPPPAEPLPTAPVPDRAALEAQRAACTHGPYFVDAASGQTCARCGAYHPGGWTWRCLQGYVPKGTA